MRAAARLDRLERESRRRQPDPDDDVILVVFDESEITERHRRKAKSIGVPIIILDR